MDSLPITRIVRPGTMIDVSIEEGRNFRRLTFTRYRLVFGDWQSVGDVHFYPTELDELREAIDSAEFWMNRISLVGIETAGKEASDV